MSAEMRGYLSGVGVAITSTNRRGVNHRTRLALRPSTRVQIGIFKTGGDNQKHKKIISPIGCHTVCIFYLQCNVMFFAMVLDLEQGFGICIWLLFYYYYYFWLICSPNVLGIVLLLRERNEVSVVLLFSVQSEASQTQTHTNKAHSYHLAALYVRWKLVPAPG